MHIYSRHKANFTLDYWKRSVSIEDLVFKC